MRRRWRRFPPVKHMDAETYAQQGFVDPELKQAADRELDRKTGKPQGNTKLVVAPKGRLY